MVFVNNDFFLLFVTFERVDKQFSYSELLTN